VFSEEVASEKATPGGGSVAAYMGALGASLVCMVSRITLRKKDRSPEAENLRDVIERCERLRETLLMLTVEDSEAFNRVMQAFKISKERSEERKKAVQEATLKAAQVPLSTMEAALEMLRMAEKVATYGNSNAMSDVLTAVGAGEAAIHGAASNVLINLASLDDRKAAESMARRVSEIQREASELVQRLVKTIQSRSSTK
ncbi:cyclodeaminase/cyclohydrolase family protein, partial [Candidatus Bathyarchaeota archaeon]